MDRPHTFRRLDSAIKIIPLGGVEEIGINCTAIEYQGQILVIDAGLGFPMSDQYGIDFIIPNTDYLQKNKKRIKAIVITHAHLDHIGALPYILKPLDFPVLYGSPFSLELIKLKLEETDFLDKVKMRPVYDDTNFVVGPFKVSFFRVNHSIPQSYGVIVKTQEGTIVHTGDFKFDNSPVNEPTADYAKIAQIGAEGVLTLISDSTNSFKIGHSKSEKAIEDSLFEIVKNAKGRVIVATFASLVNRLYQLIMIAQKTNRKVAIAGRSMENAIEIARKLRYITVPEGVFIPTSKIKTLPKENVLILATGAQGENFAALARMTRGEHRDIKIESGDSIILSASIIPGNDILVQALIDELSQKGASIFHNSDIMDLHSSGHGYQEDQKLMLNLVKPKFFMPVHGYQSFLFKHAQTAQEVGVPKAHTIIAKRGDIVNVHKDKFEIKGRVKAQPVLVSGSGVGDIGTAVLAERQQLANYGILITSVNINATTKKLIGEAFIHTFGLIYVKDNFSMLEHIKTIVKQVVESHLQHEIVIKQLREDLQRKLKEYVYSETERDPIIVPVVTLSY